MNATQAQLKALYDAFVAPADHLGHSGDIHYITNVSIDYLHQPWRAFATIINKCLSGKDTAYEKIRLSRAQFLWGMYKNKNIDYVYLLWEDFLFQVENKDTKKTNKMLYLRFTKVIIDYFMSRDQSISRRNKMFWHTARDDTMFTSMRCVSRHEKTQYVRKKIESDTSPKKKTAPASKGSRLKSPAKVAKTDKKKQPAVMPKTKGLVILSEVALTEAKQINLATKRSKTQFHSSHTSGSGNEVDTQSKTFSQDEEDDDEETDVNDDSDETETDNDGDDLTHPNFTTYKVDDEEEEHDKADDEEEQEKANDEEMSSDHRVSTPPEYELTKEEEENKEGDDKDKEGEQEQDDKDDLYRDVNINLERSDAEMTDAQANKDTKDACASNSATAKFQLTLSMYLFPITAETPSSDTTIPPPPIPINQPLQQTPESTTTTTIPTKTLPDIPNFTSLFWFEQRVSALETEMSEFKQTNQFVDDVFSIPGIVDNYLASKMKDAMDVVVQLQTYKHREEVQAENHEFLNQSMLKFKKILIDKIETNKSSDRLDVQKDLYKALVESYNSDKDIISSYDDVVTLKRSKEAESSKEPTHKESKSTSSSKGASRYQPKSSGKSAHAKEHGQKVDDLEDQLHQEFNTGNDDETSI
ncbi:hypothetical protein Tco_1272399 [Tanacetum coccineum]